MKKVVVIGAGIGGLASAALLAKKGYKVTLLEKNSSPGGRAMQLKAKGFTYDMGPSWYLLPDVFNNFFKKFDRKTSDFYKIIKLDPSYRIFLEEGKSIDIHSKLEKNKETFESFEKGSFNKLLSLLKISEIQYKVSMQHFVNKNVNSIFDLMNLEALRYSNKLLIFRSLHNHIKRFFTNEILIKIVLYSVLFLGGMPKKTPALFSMMSYIDYKLGVWYPKGGIIKIVEALVHLGSEYGVEYIFNADVKNIVVENNKAKAVKYNSTEIEADIVVSNADYAFTETKLLDSKYSSYKKKYWESKVLAPSAFVLYLGLNKKLKSLTHHNVFISSNWDEHFDEDILKDPKWPRNPSIYVSATAKTDPETAPDGCENIFITVPVAPDLQDDEETKENYKNKIIGIIESYTKESIKNSIIYSRIQTVSDYKNMYNAYKGTALGLAPTLFQSAFFKPKNKSKKVWNLYYTGQYVSPGAGVPMCLVSAELVSELIEKNEK